MKLQITILLLILTFSSCKEKDRKKSKTEKNKTDLKVENIIEQSNLKTEFEFSVVEIDSLKLNGFLKKKEYSLMSTCGGGLDGFYFKNKLVFINAIYKGESGFIKQELYLKGIEFSKIIYQEHFPEDEKYLKKYPLEKFKYDENKLTFSDTIYKIELGENTRFKKISNGKVISTKIDNELINKLINCGNIMRKELETDIE
ncbi:hypothetical protein [Aquimarina sp. 2201CG14-23]|uniref:hypothetical protein n=1 Tax=Aquimarina mycalae TaxID=3040073 RepID=UPI002477F184|nr:hypothetical protein [Aquimarina sp. 2201CG14-23]MDH7448404.1 hypothetical protein [Aquimarina sp. 2201CG14-23]